MRSKKHIHREYPIPVPEESAFYKGGWADAAFAGKYGTDCKETKQTATISMCQALGKATSSNPYTSMRAGYCIHFSYLEIKT